MRMWLSDSCVIVSIANLLFILLGRSTIEKTVTMTTVFLVFVDFRLITTICFISLTKHLTAWWKISEHLMATHLIKSRVPTSLIPFHSRIVTVANWTILNIVTIVWAQKSKPLLIFEYIGLKPADKATFFVKVECQTNHCKGVEWPAKRCDIGFVAGGVQEQAQDILVPPLLWNCLTEWHFLFPVILSPPEQWSLQ